LGLFLRAHQPSHEVINLADVAERMGYSRSYARARLLRESLITPAEAGRHVDQVAAEHFAAVGRVGISGALALDTSSSGRSFPVPLDSDDMDAYLGEHTGREVLVSRPPPTSNSSGG
jgi:hypothetical protein